MGKCGVAGILLPPGKREKVKQVNVQFAENELPDLATNGVEATVEVSNSQSTSSTSQSATSPSQNLDRRSSSTGQLTSSNSQSPDLNLNGTAYDESLKFPSKVSSSTRKRKSSTSNHCAPAVKARRTSASSSKRKSGQSSETEPPLKKAKVSSGPKMKTRKKKRPCSAAFAAPGSTSQVPKIHYTKRATVYNDETVYFPQHGSHPDEWRYEPRTPVEADFHPDREPGMLSGVSSFDAAGTIFCHLLSDALPILLEETNRHGRQRCSDGSITSYKWEDIDEAELATFLGLYMAMGDCNKNDYNEYWDTSGITNTPCFAKHMSRRRFRQIKQNLHFENNDTAVLEGWDDDGAPSRDFIFKIRRFMKAAFDKFREVRAPERQLSVDEQMVKFMGQFTFKVIMKNKPISKGFKFYVLTCARTGYCLSAVMHAGNYGNDEALETFDKVWEVLEEANVLDQGHELYMDNYYTSYPLVSEAYEREVFCVGTVKGTMTAGLPPVLSDKKSATVKSLQKGQAVFLHTDKLSMCTWRDSAPCVMLYSLPNVVDDWTNCQRKDKTGASRTPITLPMPSIFHFYNTYMGGVDLLGQHAKNSSCHHFRTKKWYTSIGHHVLTTATTNTFVIMRDGILPGNEIRLTARNVRKLIAEDLLTMGHKLRTLPPSVTGLEVQHHHKKRAATKKGHLRLDSQLNHLVEPSTRRQCAAHKQCKWTKMQCSVCKVPLCCFCFVRYHTLEYYMYDDPLKQNSQNGRHYKKAL